MPKTVTVALRKESVDRNVPGEDLIDGISLSLSARRAWIEMTYVILLPRAQVVALRKESVDRNEKFEGVVATKDVALRKESVDRN